MCTNSRRIENEETADRWVNPPLARSVEDVAGALLRRLRD
jgi:hypothetical protein